MFCQKCGTDNKDGAAFCNSCGAKLKMPDSLKSDRTCKNCGKLIPEGMDFCLDCGRMASLGLKDGVLTYDTPDKKENRVIRAKIMVKNVEYENNEGWGPTLLIIFGLIGAIVLIGIPCIIIGVWWSYKRADNRNTIKAEIDALTAELE